MFQNRIEIQTFPPGYVLLHEGSTDGFLAYLVTGALEVIQKDIDDEGREVRFFDCMFQFLSWSMPVSIFGAPGI